jgi:hypothetical protein
MPITTGGTLTLGTITFEVARDDYTFARQPATISTALVPERSRYGTLQNPLLPSTNTPKWIWVVQGAWLTLAQVQVFRTYVDSSTVTHSFADNAVLKTIMGGTVNATVRLIVGDDWIGEVACAGTTEVYQVAFTALEV